MELVYLWINNHYNEHKNAILNKNDFNFSSKFNVKYENKVLNIRYNNLDYNLFYNKNITAIVGKNGSGKSTLLQMILRYIEVPRINKDEEVFYFIKIYYCSNNNELYIINNLNINEKNIKTDFRGTIKTNYDSNINFLNENFYYYFSQNYDIQVEWEVPSNFFSYNNSQNIFVEPDKYNRKMNLEIEQEKVLKKIFYSMKKKEVKTIDLRKFAYPTNVLFKIDDKRLVEKETLKKYPDDNEKNILSKIDDEYLINRMDKKLLLSYNIIYFYKLINKYFKDIKLEKDLIKLSLSNIEEYTKLCLSKKQSILQIEENYIKNKKNHEFNYTNNLVFNELKKIFELFDSIDILLNSISHINFDTGIASVYLKNNLLEEELNVLINLPRYFICDIYFNDVIEYNELSTGEKSLLELIYSIENIILLRKKTQTKSIFILLDEIENNLNPNWQKKLIMLILEYFKDIDISLHFIITTHSPFILSDLPKENVIFLKNGKQEKPFKDNEQTFGANIHTLLSHGFFMEDGLMGEFAKNKISDVIKILKKPQLSEDEIKDCKHIISIIGEPILQKTLEHQLNEKLNPNETELQKLEREQKEIQEKIDKLKRENNETN